MTLDERVYWIDGYSGEVMGGIWFRSFDLNKFIKEIEATQGKVVGIKFVDNNCELMVEKKVD